MSFNNEATVQNPISGNVELMPDFRNGKMSTSAYEPNDELIKVIGGKLSDYKLVSKLNYLFNDYTFLSTP